MSPLEQNLRLWVGATVGGPPETKPLIFEAINVTGSSGTHKTTHQWRHCKFSLAINSFNGAVNSWASCTPELSGVAIHKTPCRSLPPSQIVGQFFVSNWPTNPHSVWPQMSGDFAFSPTLGLPSLKLGSLPAFSYLISIDRWRMAVCLWLEYSYASEWRALKHPHSCSLAMAPPPSFRWHEVSQILVTIATFICSCSRIQTQG